MPRLAHIPPNPQGAKLDLVSPGSRGLNLEQQSAVLPAQWATEAQNAIIDSNGRLAARLGFTNQTTTPISGTKPIKTLFEHRTGTGGVTTILAWDGGISTSVTNPSGSDISGSVTNTNGRWQFVNFNNKAIGFQAGQKLIVRTTGNFATVVESSGSAPTGGVGTAAYGRIWQLQSDGQTIQYSGLLDETVWTGASSGIIDMHTIWVDGTDTVTAIGQYNHQLVVFGTRHIVFFSDNGTAGVLGLDPSKIQVIDIITGTGCLTQHSLAPIGDADLMFLSPTGVQSLARLQVQRGNPLATETKYVRTEMQTQLLAEVADNITAIYSPTNNLYLIAFPVSGYVWALNTKRRYTDEEGDDVTVVTRWLGTFTAMYETVSKTLYVARTASKAASYSGNTDEGSSYRYIWLSPWMDFSEQQLGDRLKIMKRIGGIFFFRTSVNVIFNWYTDFNLNAKTLSANIAGGTSSEFAIAQYSINEWSGSSLLQLLTVPARAVCQYLRVGIQVDVTGPFAVQQSQIFAKIGRTA